MEKWSSAESTNGECDGSFDSGTRYTDSPANLTFFNVAAPSTIQRYAAFGSSTVTYEESMSATDQSERSFQRTEYRFILVQWTRTQKYFFSSAPTMVFETITVPISASSAYASGRPAFANQRMGIGIASWDAVILSQRRMDRYPLPFEMYPLLSRYSRNCTTECLLRTPSSIWISSKVGEIPCSRMYFVTMSRTFCCLSVSIERQ